MSFTITCPICGPRNIYEFRFGGEDRGKRPFKNEATKEEWYDYIHARSNPAGVQPEMWYHRDGCGVWFAIDRDTTTNQEVKKKGGDS